MAMMTLRSAQMSALEQALQDEFLVGTCQYVRREMPKKAATLPPDELQSLVAAALECARSRGCSHSWDLWRFALFSVAFGKDFFRTESWASPPFADESLTPTARLDKAEFYWRNYLAKHFQ